MPRRRGSAIRKASRSKDATNLFYFDLFDTDRTPRYAPKDARENATECGFHQIKLAILRGRIPVFSQSQGIDTVPLIEIQQDPTEGPLFRGLVRQGHIKFLMLDMPDLVSTAIRDLSNERQKFAVWTGVNPRPDGRKPEMDRRALIAALKSKSEKNSADLDEQTKTYRPCVI
jgi:hypothetical protein